MTKLFGVTTAMVTPFTSDDTPDIDALAQLTEMLISHGVNCLYPCGTTGEMLRMTLAERKAIAETVIKTAKNRVPVFIHVGCMRQDDTIELAQHAVAAGAQGIGVVTPQFFGCNDTEMEEYFVAVANSIPTTMPVYLYNIPQCAANDLKTSVIKNIMARTTNVVGVKYSFADMARTVEYLNIVEGFSVLHGADKLFASMLTMGCDGTVSGCSCVFPEPYVKVYQAFKQGNLAEAQRWQAIAVRFGDLLTNGANMAVFKAALNIRGLNAGHMRKPQLDLNAEQVTTLRQALTQLCRESGVSLTLN
ncbi:dihydrodipicolinate synthase family protein [Pectobacteriaceae bacterium CE90]|nr:dihydrodipicolinate synthase family protein [Pectobacteriaceae bacterium CE90]